MAIRHSITLSTTEPNNEVGNLKIRQGDEQTQTLEVQITADGVPMSFVGYQPFFCAKLGQTAGLGIVEQKITGTMNPANGTLEYVMRPEDWQKVGRQIGYFAFRKMKNDHEWTEQFTTRDFTYTVIPSVTGEIREVKKDGSTYIWTIEDMLRLFKEYIATGKIEWENYKNDERTIWETYRLAEKINWDDYKLQEKNEWKNYKDDEKAAWEKFVEDNREFLETADPGGKIILELLGARGEASTLGERLDSEKAEVTARLAQTVDHAKDVEINVKLPFVTGLTAAKGDGVTDDWQALTDIAQYCVDNGYRMKIPEGDFIISKPLEIPHRLILSGNGRRTKIIKKSSVVDSLGRNTVLSAHQKNGFEIKNLELVGDRTDYVSGNKTTVDGLTLSSCSYFSVESVWVIHCKRGYFLETNYCCSYIRLTAQQCQGYAFTLRNATTSTTMINPTGWGCGGMFDMIAVIYSTIINPACDHSDAGGHPQDPFLPDGSGGDYKNPSFIYSISASNVVIISSGTENSYSKYLYAEGGSIVFMNPFVYNIELHSENFSFMELRGQGTSSVDFINPDFRTINNMLTPSPTRRGFYIENPDRQKIKTNRHITLNETFGDYTYNGVEGVEYAYKSTISNLNQNTIEIGGTTPLIVDDSRGSIQNVYVGTEKRVKLINSQAETTDFRLPLNVSRFNQIKLVVGGYQSSQYGSMKCRVVEVVGGVKNVLRNFSVTGGDFVIRDIINVDTTYPCFLEFTSAWSTDTIYLTKMEVFEVL